MSAIAVIIPVLGRPANAAKVVRSLRDSGSDALVWFSCSPGDNAQIEACQQVVRLTLGTGVETVGWQPGRGDWARKINGVARHEGALVLPPDGCEFLLLGADDLHFHPGWDTEALRVAEATGAGVIGTNDLGNPSVKRGAHSTHPLVRRSYIEQHGTIDEPGKVLHEGYWHNWSDVELVETAKARGEWAFAARSHVEHLHPLWHKAEMDATYERGLDQRKFEEDRRLLQRRRKLWRGALADIERGERIERRRGRMRTR